MTTQIAAEPSDVPARVTAPDEPAETITLAAVDPHSAAGRRAAASRPVVLSVPLHGIPCGVCGKPAVSMDTEGCWSRTWHTIGSPCDVGIPPRRPVTSEKGRQ